MKPRILVVDDDESIRTMLAMSLEAFGWDVQLAKDGVEGLQAWRIFKGTPMEFKVVSTDFDMPEMNGLRMTAAILKESPHATVFMFSGTSEARELILELGAKGFYDKLHPFQYLQRLEESI